MLETQREFQSDGEKELHFYYSTSEIDTAVLEKRTSLYVTQLGIDHCV